MILLLPANSRIISTLSSHERRSCFFLLGLISSRLSSIWNYSQLQLTKKPKQLPYHSLKSSLFRRSSGASSLRSSFQNKKMSQVLASSGKKKYSPILTELTERKFCRVQCALSDVRTVIGGVMKEKVEWVKKKKWPKGQVLKTQIIDTEDWKGILFKMLEDTSIRNL